MYSIIIYKFFKINLIPLLLLYNPTNFKFYDRLESDLIFTVNVRWKSIIAF